LTSSCQTFYHPSCLSAPCAHHESEVQEANKSLDETAKKLKESESYCLELEGKLSLLEKISEHALTEERSRVREGDAVYH